MGLVFSRPRLGINEDIVWRRLANHFQPSGRAVGGRLLATNTRLLFQPHHLDQAFRGQAWERRLVDIGSAEVARPGAGPDKIRNTLRVVGISGRDDFFVVRNPAEVASRLGGAHERPNLNSPPFRSAWTQYSPYYVLVSTAFFLAAAIIRPNIYAEVYVLAGAIYSAFFLRNVIKRRSRSGDGTS